MTPPFSASQKVETLPLFPHPSPLLISDKSLAYFEPTGSCFPNLICSRIVRVCNDLSVHKYSKNFSSPCSVTSLANLSERIRERKPLHSPFFLYPTFARNLLPTSYPSFKELINNSRKYRIFFILRSNHQNMSKNSIWLANDKEFSLGHKTRVHCLFAKALIPVIVTTLRSHKLDSELFHGYKDLAGQSSWWSILFCVYVSIHWSKAVALFAQFLSSLPERNWTNERRPW